MKKQYCDFCGVEIEFKLYEQVDIYNPIEFRCDACEKCGKKVLEFLKTLKK